MEWISAIYETIIDFFKGLADFLINVRDEVWEFLKNPTEVLNAIWEFLKYVFYWISNEIVQKIAEWINSIRDSVPDLFAWVPDTGTVPANIIAAINWVFPLDTLIQCIGAIGTATVVYITTSWVLRWIKIIR